MTKSGIALALVFCCATGRSFADTDCFPGDVASGAKAAAETANPALPRAAAVANVVSPDAGRHDQVRIHDLESSLRCLVCQNETIADSTADLAADLRAKIQEQVAQGLTDDQIRDYMVTRYGDFVLYDPPFRQATWLLWIGPFVLLALGFFVLARMVSQRRRLPDAALTDLERQRAKRLLDEGDPP